MFGLKKKKKNLRQKIVIVNSDEEIEDNKTINDVNFSKNLIAQPLLSFGDEDGEDQEMFKIKKSYKSRLISKSIKKDKLKDTVEILNVLDDDKTLNKNYDLNIKLHNPLKPKKIYSTEILPIQILEKVIEDDEQKDVDDPLKSTLQAGEIPNAAMIFAARKQRQYVRETLNETPNTNNHNEILQIKEYSDNGFSKMNLDDTIRYASTKSRLIREDDNDISDADETETFNEMNESEDKFINMSTILEKESKEKYRSKKELLKYLDKDRQKKERGQENQENNLLRTHKVSMQSYDSNNDESGKDSEDEEFEKWENEQIRKGYNMPQLLNLPSKQHMAKIIQNFSKSLPSSNQMKINSLTSTSTTTLINQNDNYAFQPPYHNLFNDSLPQYNNEAQKKMSVTLKIPDFLSREDEKFNISNFDCDRIKRDIEKRIETLKSNTSVFNMDLTNTIEFQAGNEALFEHLKEETLLLQTENTFYTDFREYIEDLIDCLNEKVVIINSLENRIHNLWKQRSSRLINRRLQDLKDESQEYSLIQIMNNKLNTKQQPEDAITKRRISEREARRGRRRRARENTNVNHFEGMSTDDEEIRVDKDNSETQMKQILSEASPVFQDVVEDFCVLENILAKFDEWKNVNKTSYKEAYINLYLSSILENLVRFHSLGWNPLDDDSKEDFKGFAWYKTLLSYMVKKDSSTDNNVTSSSYDQDSDINVIIPNVIQNVFLPKLTFVIQYVYDPMSTKQTKRIVDFIKFLAQTFPFFLAENTKIQQFYKIIQQRIVKSLENDIYLPMFPLNILETKNSAIINYQNRQFWSSIKLMDNIMEWKSLLSHELIKELAFDGILNRYIILAFQNSLINRHVFEKSLKISQTLKLLSDFNRDEKGNLLSEFQPFHRYLNYLQQTVKNMSLPNFNVEFSPLDKIETLDIIEEIIQNF